MNIMNSTLKYGSENIASELRREILNGQILAPEKLAAESYPVGSGERLRNALLRLRSLLIDEARGNLRSLYPAPVSIMNINYSA